MCLKDKERSPVPLTPGSLSKMDTVNEVCLLQSKLPDTDRDPFNGNRFVWLHQVTQRLITALRCRPGRSPDPLASKAKCAAGPALWAQEPPKYGARRQTGYFLTPSFILISNFQEKCGKMRAMPLQVIHLFCNLILC